MKSSGMRGTVACVVIAIAALFLSYLAAGNLYLTGFPDGHLTDYDKAVDTPEHILMWVELGFIAPSPGVAALT